MDKNTEDELDKSIDEAFKRIEERRQALISEIRTEVL